MPFLGVGVCEMRRGDIFGASGGLAVRVEHTVGGDLPALSGETAARKMYAQSLPSLTVRA